MRNKPIGVRGAAARPARIGAAIALLLSGCVSDHFRQTVGTFATATKASVAAEDARLAAVSADEDARFHARLALTPTDLRLDPACAATLAAQSAGIASTPAPCFLTDAHGQPIGAPPDFAHLHALGAALAAYSDSLVLLAADSSADQAAFYAAVLGLGAAAGGLDDAVRKASGAAPVTDHATTDAVAGIVASAGKLLLSAQRGRALRHIVIATDPAVQRASALLAQADDRLRLYDLATLAPALFAAQGAASDAIGRHAAVADIRAAQDALFAQVAAYNQAASEASPYAAIGAAHAKLAVAARRGATLAELTAAIGAVLDLAGQVGALAAPAPPPPAGPPAPPSGGSQ